MLVALCLTFTACPKRPTTRPPRPEVEHRRPEVIRPNGQDSPEQKAADQLIVAGIAALKDDDAEKAATHFEQAVRIASSYGPAYYWLARAKYDLDQLTRAWDLLDRAELLIGHESRWLERIDQLRAAISDAR